MFWLAAAAGTKIAGGLISGVSAMSAANKEAALTVDQGLISRNDYYRQAAITYDEGYRLQHKQEMEYIGAGVEIMGTPLLVMAETISKTEKERDWLKSRGDKEYDLAKLKARNLKNQGKAALVSSIFGAASDFASYKAAG